MNKTKKVLLIITGGIAAYKSLEIIRGLKANNIDVTCILTKSGSEFVTPLSIESLSENKVYTDLFNLTDEHEMGHYSFPDKLTSFLLHLQQQTSCPKLHMEIQTI